AGPAEARAQHLQQRGLRVDREDVPGRADRPREPQREVPGTRPDLGDHLTAPEPEGVHDADGLLPHRALRIELSLDHAGQIGRVAVTSGPAVSVRAIVESYPKRLTPEGRAD